MLKALISLLYPSYCHGCRTITDYDQVFCAPCREALPVPSACPTKHASASTEKRSVKMHRRAVTTYNSSVGTLARAKQWRSIGAAHALGLLVADALSTSGATKPVIPGLIGDPSYPDLIIAVPLHISRYAWRGYNQATVMGEVVAQRLGIPLIAPFRRVRRTRFQIYFSGKGRHENVKGVFARRWFISKAHARTLLAGKRVLLIDDVCTTGATLASLAKEVRRYKPASVTAVVACQVEQV